MNFGETLKAYRLEYGMNIKTLAERTNINADHLGRIEGGSENPPREKTITRIIEMLHLSPEKASILREAAKTKVH